MRLPADYIAAHTTLGYARTIDSAQGVTAGGRDIDGTCHIVGSDRLTRQQLYVACTRGKNENHIYFSTAEADPHRILAPKATHPPDRRRHPLGRSCAATAPRSPPTAPRPPNPTRSPGCTPRPRCTPTRSPRPPNTLAGAATMAHIDAAAAAIRANITDCGAWPVLRRNLALLAVDGHDPIEALHAAAATPLGNPIDVAAVLDWRLQPPPGSAAAAGRSAALAGGHPRRAGRTPPMGPLPARALPARRRSGRPDPRRRAPMAARLPSRPGRAPCWLSNPS